MKSLISFAILLSSSDGLSMVTKLYIKSSRSEPSIREFEHVVTESQISINRRTFLIPIIGSLALLGSGQPRSALASSTMETKALLDQLEQSRQKLDDIPSLLQKEDWDSVRQILKTPPVNFLWNLGDTKNPILQLAKATDDFELIELKDELSLNLQMCDQLTYDNVFVVFQPGNGKINVKEPIMLAKKAMAQLDEAISAAKSSL